MFCHFLLPIYTAHKRTHSNTYRLSAPWALTLAQSFSISLSFSANQNIKHPQSSISWQSIPGEGRGVRCKCVIETAAPSRYTQISMNCNGPFRGSMQLTFSPPPPLSSTHRLFILSQSKSEVHHNLSLSLSLSFARCVWTCLLLFAFASLVHAVQVFWKRERTCRLKKEMDIAIVCLRVSEWERVDPCAKERSTSGERSGKDSESFGRQ